MGVVDTFRQCCLWRPGIALGVTQRQPEFKLITWHAKSQTTKSIRGLYYSRPQRSVARPWIFDFNHLFVEMGPFWSILLNNWHKYSNRYKLKTVKLVSFWRLNFYYCRYFSALLVAFIYHSIPATCVPNITWADIYWYVTYHLSSHVPVNICCKRMYVFMYIL